MEKNEESKNNSQQNVAKVEKKQSETKKISTGTIIGISIGVVIAILLIVIIVLLLGKGQDPNNQNSNNSNNNTTEKTTNNTPTKIEASSYEELEKVVNDDITKTTSELDNEFQTLSASITSYNDYVKKKDDVKAFYEKVVDTTDALNIRMREYALKYAQLILSTEKSYRDKYKAMDDLKDAIYDDAGDDIKDAIYEDLSEDIKKAFYSGVLKKCPDGIDYSNWYDISSDDYSNWYDMSSDVYSSWYDMSSDVYEFYYELASEIYSNDEDGIQDKLDDFQKDINKLKGVK